MNSLWLKGQLESVNWSLLIIIERPLCTHQALAVAESHSGRAVLISQESYIVTVIYHVMTPLQPFFAPVLHCKMFRHQVGVECQV